MYLQGVKSVTFVCYFTKKNYEFFINFHKNVLQKIKINVCVNFRKNKKLNFHGSPIQNTVRVCSFRFSMPSHSWPKYIFSRWLKYRYIVFFILSTYCVPCASVPLIGDKEKLLHLYLCQKDAICSCNVILLPSIIQKFRPKTM